MDLHLSGKMALVTGASRGIGRATAIMLAEEGCDLILVARQSVGLAQVAADISVTADVRVQVIAADLAHQDDVERLATEVPKLDILVNNAGAIPLGGLFDVDDEAWRAGWNLKVFGYIGTSRALYSALKAQRGVIINIIGAAGEYLDPNYIAGSTGNAALMAFTRTMAKTASADGVRVVGINPGPVATQRYKNWMRERAEKAVGDAEHWSSLDPAEPLGRAATPEEIASAVCFLASPRSAYTTGTILTIDGALR